MFDQRSLSRFSSKQLLEENNLTTKRTKMVNTIGPSCNTVQMLGELIDHGMNVVRLNFSHGTHQSHQILFDRVKQAINNKAGRSVAIMLDTKGPQIRTGMNQNKGLISLIKGQLLQITTNYEQLCTQKRISCSYKDLPKSTQVGKKILFADGGISSIVKKIQENIVTVQIMNNGELGSKKNMCLPGTAINLPTVTEKDKEDILKFGLKNKINYIALSFTRYKSDLDDLRKLLIQADPDHGGKIQLISKIQNHQGIEHIDEIIDGSDGIMIARGDLGMEVPIQKVTVLQKYITEKTVRAGKYVITATQLLDSMEKKPRPTRAEVSDVTNAIMDLSDAVMTSGQTANGQFPVQTVKMMCKIAVETEKVIDYAAIFQRRKPQLLKLYKQQVQIIQESFKTECQIILLQTTSLQTARKFSFLRPKAHICLLTNNPYIKNASSFYFGVYCFDYEQNLLKFIFQNTTNKTVKILNVQQNEEGYSHNLTDMKL